ncbi:MAG: glycine zipper domain-containing protein [Planctomycetota bacterium]
MMTMKTLVNRIRGMHHRPVRTCNAPGATALRRSVVALGLSGMLGFAMLGSGCRSDAQAGAGLGALLGAGAGYVIGNETGAGEGEGALIGAAVGGAVGYGLGNEQDKKKMRTSENYNW